MLDYSKNNYDTGQTGYVHIGTYPEGGYTCSGCGTWVPYYQSHYCYMVSPPYYYGYVPTWQPTFNPILGEIKELLEKVIELLSRE